MMRTPFLTDQEQPLDSVADEFSHVDYVAVIVEAVAQLPSPFTLGLFGPWGAGKSSILRAVGTQLDRPSETAFVLFDAWKYEGDPLRRQFMIEVTRQLKSEPSTRDIAVIAVSGAGPAAEVRANALEAGCDDFVAKPFMIDTLIDRVHHWLRAGDDPAPERR